MGQKSRLRFRHPLLPSNWRSGSEPCRLLFVTLATIITTSYVGSDDDDDEYDDDEDDDRLH